MGQSETIKDKQKSDEEFRKFMSQVEKESRDEEKNLVDAVKARVKVHYEGNGWDYSRLFGDSRSDYQNYSDWSLDRINKIITTIGNALGASDYPSEEVPGSESAKPDTIQKAKDFAGIFAGDLSLIIARVTALLAGFMAQFSVASSASQKSVLQDLPLSGGLHLFTANSGKVFQAQNFFSNQYIGSFQIVFEAYMSVDEARAIGLQQILATTERELAFLNDEIIAIREAQTQSLKEILKKNPQDYASTRAVYTLALADVKADRAKLLEEYTKYNQVVATVDRLFHKLDLSEFHQHSASRELLPLNELFDEWEVGLARRYISEKLSR